MSDAVDLNGSVGEVIREAASLLDVAWARIDAELLMAHALGLSRGDMLMRQRDLSAPSDFAVPIREVRVSAGAEFLVVVCGDIMTMPGLPRVPAANNISVNDAGQIEGLF